MFRNAVQQENLGVTPDAAILEMVYSQPFVNKYGDTSQLSNAAFVNFPTRTSCR